MSLLFGLGMMTNNILAQESAITNFGVNAGLNISNVSFEGISGGSKTGFHAGASFEYHLLNSRPIYLETGIQFTQKGYQISGLGKANANYLEVPVMVNYKFYSPAGITFYPSIGVYCGYGIGGKVKTVFDDDDFLFEDESSDSFFGEDGFNRLDFGVRLGVSAQWQQIVLGVGYERGLINIGNGSKAHTSNIYISLGYRF